MKWTKRILSIMLFAYASQILAVGQMPQLLSKTYIYPNDSVIRSDVIFSNFLVNPIAHTIIFPSNSNNNQFLDLDYWRKLDYEGTTLISKTEDTSNQLVYYNQQLSYTSNDFSTFLAGGIKFTTDDSFFSFIVQMQDSNLHSLWYKTIDTKYDRAYVSSIVNLGDGTHMIAGMLGRYFIDSAYPAVPPMVYLLKLNDSGQILWQKTVDSGQNNIVYGATLGHDGNILLCGRTRGYGTPDDGAAFVMKVDTAGNKLWLQSYNVSRLDFVEKIVATPDGNYVCAGGKASDPEIQDMPNSAGRIFKISENGSLIWDRIIDDNPRTEYFTTVVVAHNSNDVIAFGSSWKYYAYDQYNYMVGSTRGPDGFAVRLDANGNELWNRVFGHNAVPEAHEYIYNAVALPDGGFLATGTTHIADSFWNAQAWSPYFRQSGWLVRLDANGCVDAACSEITGIPKAAAPGLALKLYPNPGSGQARLEADRPLPAEGRLRVVDVLGRLLWQKAVPAGMQQMEIDLRGRAPGLYLVQLLVADKWYNVKYLLQ